MRLLVWEWRKLFRLPALWVFLGLCLVLNGVLLSAPSALDRAFFIHPLPWASGWMKIFRRA